MEASIYSINYRLIKILKLIFTINAIVLICFQYTAQEVKIFGHRGCRGLLPENSIISFKKAIELGVNGIEWDVVVNKDHELIISHEPYIDISYCKKIDTNNNSSTNLNIYEMTTDEIRLYDCGNIFNKEFPDQKLASITKPTVKEALNDLKEHNPIILFEIKSSEKNYGIYQPYPKAYAEIILNELKEYEFLENIIFMSFDPEMLNSLNKIMPDQKYIYLEYNPLNNFEKCLSFLNFKPYALGLYFPMINKETIKIAHINGIHVYAWTVNEVKTGNELKNIGIDGLITDYPNLFIK